jgi:CrcB protein
VRVLITTLVVGRAGVDFPYATMGINILGSFLIGFVFELAHQRSGFNPELRLFLTAGILGGFTTFSSYSYDVLNLLGKNSFIPMAIYTAGSVVIGVLAAQAGVSLVRVMAR